DCGPPYTVTSAKRIDGSPWELYPERTSSLNHTRYRITFAFQFQLIRGKAEACSKAEQFPLRGELVLQHFVG
ncbi:MAG: hypothetical protein ACE5MM_08885, partial [Nitrospiraceae bacterium]